MLTAKPRRRQARSLRWRSAPWDDRHPDWLRLDQQLPADHRARLIDRLVEQLDHQPYLRHFYAGFGSACWHPALLLKLALYELDRKVLSPAQWHRDCSEHLPLLWLLRGARPSRASLYHGRRRLSPRLLKRLNRQVLQAARQEELCSARRASLDGTFTAAKGSRHQRLNLKRLDKRLALLQQAIANDEEVATDKGGSLVQTRQPRWLARSPQGRKQQLQRYQLARQHLLTKLARHQQLQSRRAKAKRHGPERVTICPSEPEAAVGKDKTKVVRPLYDLQLLRDLDSPFLLGYGVFATTSDAGLLPVMLKRTKALCGRLPEKLLADAIYASVQDLKACRFRQVQLYAPIKRGPAAPQKPASAQPQPGRKELPLLPAEAKPAPKYYGRERFVWDNQTQSYTCPANQRLHQLSSGTDQRVSGQVVAVAVYGTKACSNCPQRAACTPSKQGRRIKRMQDEALVEELRQRMASAEGQELYKLRQQTIEREFAEAKEHRGLRQFCGYGLNQAETQAGLLTLLHNGKALLLLRQAAKQPAA